MAPTWLQQGQPSLGSLGRLTSPKACYYRYFLPVILKHIALTRLGTDSGAADLNGSAMPPTPIRSFVRSFARSLARWRARRENFSSTRKFRRRENFGKKSLGRCDRFRPRIVEIGAILAIFEPFEIRKFSVLRTYRRPSLDMWLEVFQYVLLK